jgi:hypothetical protein
MEYREAASSPSPLRAVPMNDANSELRERLRIMGVVGASQSDKDAAIAQNVLHEELGYFGEYGKRYNLAEETRDVLLANGRQDAAHALIAALRVSDQIETWGRRTCALILCATAAVILAVWLL